MRDGSPFDVPMMLFGWDKEADMHVYRGEKSKEDKERRKTGELQGKFLISKPMDDYYFYVRRLIRCL